MSLDAALEAFFAESRELLGAMEQALLDLDGGADAEAIDAVFRAAHTIKGSAGMFGLQRLVAFAHELETLLADVRAGELAVDAALVSLLLECGDHIDEMLVPEDAARPVAAEEAGRHAALLARIARLRPAAAVPVAVEAPPKGDAEASADEGRQPERSASEAWHISVRFGRDVLRDGMDPLATLRYLKTFGRVVAIETFFDAMPEAAAMDPEACYAGCEIEFETQAERSIIEGAFEFVRESSTVRILPPHARVADYLRLIEELPEDPARLGELLVASGALTRRELERGLELQHERRSADGAASEGTRLGEILLGEGSVPGEVIGAALEKQRQAKERASAQRTLMRVRSDKLDELIDLVGELVIASAGANVVSRRCADAQMTEAVSAMERLVEQVRDGALRLRMVPIGETFGRFRRVVHDLGRELGKDVELVLSGTETELDKSMVEKISDPLMHLVRNALDHGVERPEARAARGKDPRAVLRLNAYHESGSIVVEIADDGAGLDREAITRRALERGLAIPGEILDEKDLARLIMEPGFSTAREVTSVSGRGVGMDVVRRNIEAMRGTVSIASAQGAGTTVSLRLPLTLAIIDGFLVGVGPSVYVIPLEMVTECLELADAGGARIRETGYVDLRGDVLPVLRLRDVFEVEGAAAADEKIVVVQYGGRHAGFVVDALLGEFQTVIKPLGKLFERLSGIAGSTILGTGEVALILDVQELVERAAGDEARRGKRPGARGAAIENLEEGPWAH